MVEFAENSQSDVTGKSNANPQKEHAGEVVDCVDSINVIECQQCGFRHIDPLPTVEELKTTYRHDYYEKTKPLSLTRYMEDQEWYQLQYSDRYDIFEKELGDGKKRILDVGCGPGLFLKCGKERGWDTLGIEPSTQAAEKARSFGIETVEDFLTPETAKTLGQFDAVHTSLVLEHIPDPTEFLELIFSITKPGGMICLTAPNEYNPFQHALREVDGYKPWFIVPSHHLNYFTPESLGNLVEKTGYTITLKENTFPIDMFLLMGDNYVGQDELGRACHKKRIRFETTLNKAGLNPLKRELYQAFTKLNLGREICIYAKKDG